MTKQPKGISISLKNLTKEFGDFVAVDNVDLKVNKGEFLVILGPSGCGKTTLLRMIAGLERPSSGRIHFGNDRVDNVAPQKRDIGFLFQHYTLFKHMSVEKNIRFGMKMKKAPGDYMKQRTQELLDLIGLPDMGARMPAQLSGGQQQRIALARALAPKPKVLLLDESFGALDAKIRQQVRNDVKRVQRELGITTILVTHNQVEAFELGDRVAVMNKGRIEHVGKPQEIYDNPETEFVAHFVGTVNILHGKVFGNKLLCGAVELGIPENGLKFREGDFAKVLIRPEDLIVSKKRKPKAINGTVMEVRFLGPVVRMRISFGRGVSLIAVKSKAEALKENIKEGDKVYVDVTLSKVFPEEEEILVSVPVNKVLSF
jgi:ABC-type Fe3+/spermidine/putrescine transport system ATPase subunit